MSGERPIKIYGLDPAGYAGRGPKRAALVGCAWLMFCCGLVQTASASLIPAVQDYFSRLPFYRPELSWVGLALLGLLGLAMVHRYRRWRLAQTVRAELYSDRLRVEQAGNTHEYMPVELQGYRASVPEAVEVIDHGGRRHLIPTPNDAVRTLVLDWLAEREVRRLDE
jgi:hypothetical protein